MTIQRTPHAVYAVLWGAWLAAVFTALALPHNPLVGLVVLLAFLPIEGSAAILKNGGSRDTLSEITTWVIRHTAKHKRFARGWNAALLGGVVVPIAALLMRTVSYYADWPALGVVMGVLVAVFLNDHFISPDQHG